MIHYDPLKDRSEQCGWKKVQDEIPPSAAEQAVWARYTVWSVVVVCAISIIMFMDTAVW